MGRTWFTITAAQEYLLQPVLNINALKIAVISTTLYRHQGADRVMWHLADDLSRQGHEVTLFIFKGQMAPPANVQMVTMGMPAGFLRERLFHLFFPLSICLNIKYARILKGFDQIFTGPYPSSWLAYMAKKCYGKKYTYYFYHFNLPGFIPGLLARNYTRLHVFMEKWTLARADNVITISQFSKKSLESFYNGPIEVVYCTVDCQRFNPELDGSRIRDKYGLKDQPVILCVGQLIPSKGMHLLIEAFNRVKVDTPDAKLLIVGKAVFPDYLNKLRALAGYSVIFAEDATDDEMPYYYAACDVYATATLWEGFNIPLAEAQACGKPVVAFDTGPHPEVIEPGVTGILVTPGDIVALSGAVIKLLNDSGLKNVMGAHGVEMVRKRFCISPRP
jgi:glycosyltransferase involved in cell wall biosynthesis